jgi:hypothetical protein
MQSVAQHLLALPPDEIFTTRTVSAALDADPMRISQSLKQLHHTAAIMIATRGACRSAGNEYRIADRSKLQARVDGALKAGRPPRPEPEYLTYAVDHDGDLQIIKPDGEAFTIDSANAKMVVAVVALQASAILMAGAQ